MSIGVIQSHFIASSLCKEAYSTDSDLDLFRKAVKILPGCGFLSFALKIILPVFNAIFGGTELFLISVDYLFFLHFNTFVFILKGYEK